MMPRTSTRIASCAPVAALACMAGCVPQQATLPPIDHAMPEDARQQLYDCYRLDLNRRLVLGRTWERGDGRYHEAQLRDVAAQYPEARGVVREAPACERA